MHVAEIKKTYKGKQHATTLVRRSFREGRKVKHETIVNISGLPQDVIEAGRPRPVFWLLQPWAPFQGAQLPTR